MRIPRICCAAFVVAFLPFGSFAADKETAYDRVVRTGTLRCGYGVSPPVLAVDPNTGAVSGLDYDLWQEIGKELDLKIEFAEEAGWGNFIEGLRTGRYDAFCSQLWADAGRIKYASLTIPVLYSFLKVYVRADDHRFDGNLEAINVPEAIIPAIEGDVSVKMASERFPRATVHTLPQTATVSDMLLAVKTRKADVVFLDPSMLRGFEQENPGVLRALEGVPAPYVFASFYAVRSGEIQLRDMIDVALRKIIDDGRMERLARRYSADFVAPRKNVEAHSP